MLDSDASTNLHLAIGRMYLCHMYNDAIRIRDDQLKQTVSLYVDVRKIKYRSFFIILRAPIPVLAF